jgi:hypothetical protein
MYYQDAQGVIWNRNTRKTRNKQLTVIGKAESHLMKGSTEKQYTKMTHMSLMMMLSNLPETPGNTIKKNTPIKQNQVSNEVGRCHQKTIRTLIPESKIAGRQGDRIW